MNLARGISNAKQSIIVRTITSQTGERYLAHILVIETENGVDLRVLSAKPIAADEANTTVAGVLIGDTTFQPIFHQEILLRKTISPFTSDFTFFTSQPTRAPACK